MTTSETMHGERRHAVAADRQLCAGALFAARDHRVGPDDAEYALVGPTGRRWLFCSRACLVGWCELVADGTLDRGHR